jgi:hypothetical protein
VRSSRTFWHGLLTSLAVTLALPASAQQPQKPNILVIMGDDIDGPEAWLGHLACSPA